MKVTLEGISIHDITEQMIDFLDAVEAAKVPKTAAAARPAELTPKPEPKAVAPKKNKGGRPKLVKAAPAVEKPVEKPVQKPVEKYAPSATDEFMRAKSTSSDEMGSNLADLVFDDSDAPEPEVTDPAKLAAIRVKTTEDLQTAYASGKHKQVLELLATYGNGAKSFRELTIKDFLPIRKAIDEGALQ